MRRPGRMLRRPSGAQARPRPVRRVYLTLSLERISQSGRVPKKVVNGVEQVLQVLLLGHSFQRRYTSKRFSVDTPASQRWIDQRP